MKNRKRDHVIFVRVSRDEAKKFQKMARDLGLSASDYFRFKMLQDFAQGELNREVA